MNNLSIDEAQSIILSDLLGFEEKNFSSAYVTVAYSNNDSIKCESMKDILAAILSERLQCEPRLVRAGLQTKAQFCHFTLMNHVAWQSLINAKLSQKNAALKDFSYAAAVLSCPHAPKFAQAIHYMLEIGDDVPSDFREEFKTFYTETLYEQLALGD